MKYKESISHVFKNSKSCWIGVKDFMLYHISDDSKGVGWLKGIIPLGWASAFTSITMYYQSKLYYLPS